MGFHVTVAGAFALVPKHFMLRGSEVGWGHSQGTFRLGYSAGLKEPQTETMTLSTGPGAVALLLTGVINSRGTECPRQNSVGSESC